LQQRLLQLASLQKQGTALPQLRDNILPGTPANKQGMDKRKEKAHKKGLISVLISVQTDNFDFIFPLSWERHFPSISDTPSIRIARYLEKCLLF
ncbi:hypothetical protein, partial [Kandleria vitulina]|uniref:hypothetical protein n=1 Tax=Kandleria vitulina TaxID=1630 RepID=UPI00055A7012